MKAFLSTEHPRGTPVLYSIERADIEARAILAETEPDIFRASYLTLTDLCLDLPRPAWTESLVESLAAILPVLEELEGEAGK